MPLWRLFFERAKGLTRWSGLTTDAHFSADATQIGAWASHKSFVRKDKVKPSSDAPLSPPGDFIGQKRKNKTRDSTTDPDARLAGKGEGDDSRLC
ncbi:hypothetical protein GCM10007907_16250 [Chitinimonas prasina]|uniref:Transposase n=1 Tax=Chitinimonas prasina TaxID=1434937 RepID=A0ABQ5YHK9_9NEIS|nr:hypothetical protein GCM10007907_16250 [Chitinimonas prasina]